MPVYTLGNLLGGFQGAQMRLVTNASYTNVGLALDCQGANGYSYVTATAPPGPNDMANTSTATIALDGTWALTNTRSNLGTTSLIIPSTGTTAYLAASATHTGYLRSGAFSTWIYLDSLPASTVEILWYTNSTGRPTNTSVYARSFGVTSTGQVQFYNKNNTNTSTRATVATIGAGAWYFISCTWFMEKVYLGINGTVESFSLPLDSTTSGSVTGMVHGIRGGTGYAGIYLDDPVGYKRHVPRLSANFTVPSVEWGSLVYAGNQMTLGSSVVNPSDSLQEAWHPNRIYSNSRSGRSELRSYTGISRLTAITSPAIAYLHGINDVDGLITPGSTRGAIRPSTGFLYPRKV